MTEWSALRKRIDRPDTKSTMHEWFMPLDDQTGKAAWRRWAESLDGRYVGGREAGVAWDFPLVPRMKRALALAEAQFHGDQQNRLLRRVVRDLRSYRDTGYSATSAERPEAKERQERREARATLARLAKPRKKPAP